MTKLTAIGSSKKYRVDIYLGAPTGQNIPKSKLIRQTFGQYKKDVYRYYSSATQSATGKVGDESKADKRGVIWRSPFIIFSIVAPILGIPLCLWFVAGIFTSGFGMADDAQKDQPEQQAEAAFVNPPPPSMSPPAQQVAPVQPVQEASRLSPVWRVAGHLERSKSTANDPEPWSSVTGYGTPAPERQQTKAPDLVMLHSHIHGFRRILASDCTRLSDGINWQCEVDGLIATPWTGRGESTHWASDSSQLVSRTASVASGATGRSDTAGALTNPPPSSTNSRL